MAHKSFTLDDDLLVTVYKRRGNRNLRLSIAANGTVRVSIPAWAPYRVGIEFARSRRAWITAQQQPQIQLQHGQPVGKAHHLHLLADPAVTRITSRVAGNAVTIRHPSKLPASDQAVQAAAQRACIRALRSQAEQLLPQRLQALAASHGFSYSMVSVKRLKGRWGSCDQHQNIVLNLFLMQLPWELIDYVLLHELLHTRVMRHGPDFWKVMATLTPHVKQLRQQLRQQQPVLFGPAEQA